jgi:hypothetical protein
MKKEIGTMALSAKAQLLLDTILGKTARVRDPGSPKPGQKLMQTEKGTWELVPDVQRFRKARGESSPALIELLQKMTHKDDQSDKAARLLKETSGVVMNEVEKRLVLEALKPEMGRSLLAHQRALKVGRPGGKPMIKRAGMSPLSGLAPAWTRPQPTRGLSSVPELEQQIVSEELEPAAAARAFVARRIPMAGIPGAGMKPRTDTDAYGVPYVPQR